MCGHTCQPPEYKNLGTSRNFCIVRMSFLTMSRNNLRKSPKRHSERPGDLLKNLEKPGELAGMCGTQALANQACCLQNFSFLTIMPPHLKALAQQKKHKSKYLQSFTKLGKLYIVFNEHCEILGSIKKRNTFATKGKGNTSKLEP